MYPVRGSYYLKREVPAINGIQEIETDGKLRLETAIDIGAKELLRLVEHRRSMAGISTVCFVEVEQQRVFFRNTIGSTRRNWRH